MVNEFLVVACLVFAIAFQTKKKEEGKGMKRFTDEDLTMRRKERHVFQSRLSVARMAIANVRDGIHRYVVRPWIKLCAVITIIFASVIVLVVGSIIVVIGFTVAFSIVCSFLKIEREAAGVGTYAITAFVTAVAGTIYLIGQHGAPTYGVRRGDPKDPIIKE